MINIGLLKEFVDTNEYVILVLEGGTHLALQITNIDSGMLYGTRYHDRGSLHTFAIDLAKINGFGVCVDNIPITSSLNNLATSIKRQ